MGVTLFRYRVSGGRFHINQGGTLFRGRLYFVTPAPEKCLYYTLVWRRRSPRSIYIHPEIGLLKIRQINLCSLYEPVVNGRRIDIYHARKTDPIVATPFCMTFKPNCHRPTMKHSTSIPQISSAGHNNCYDQPLHGYCNNVQTLLGLLRFI